MLHFSNAHSVQFILGITGFAPLHPPLSLPFVNDIVSGEFVAAYGTGAVSVEPVGDAGGMIDVGAWKSDDRLADVVGFEADAAFAVVGVD